MGQTGGEKSEWNDAALYRAAKSGNGDAREKLIQAHTPLVRAVAARFSGRGIETEDLCQIGMIGLLKAIDRFDEGRQVRFSTYAVPLIMGEIRRFLRDDGAVKVPRTLRERSVRLRRLREEMQREKGNDALRISDLARAAGLSVHETVLALEAQTAPASLDAPITSERGAAARWELLEDPRQETERVFSGIAVRLMLDKLTDAERALIRMRYYEERTQSETGKALGMTQVQVSRTEGRILQKLKKEGS